MVGIFSIPQQPTGPEKWPGARVWLHHQHHQRRGGVQHAGRAGEQAGAHQGGVLQAVRLVPIRGLRTGGPRLRQPEAVQCR